LSSSRLSLALGSLIVSALLIASISFPADTGAQTFQVIIAPGFEFSKFADPGNVPDFEADTAYTGAVSMAFDSRGRLFVGTLPGKILILLDNNEDGRADQVKTFASGITQPLGLTFRANGDLYATSNRIRGVGSIVRLRDTNGDDVADEITVIVDNLPSTGDHQTNRLKFGPDGLLYFSQGSATDNGTPKPGLPAEGPLNATIMRLDVDNPTTLQVFATGLRNAFGFALHPENGQLFATDGGSGEYSGQFEDDAPLEEINWVVQGGHYGFPGCEGIPVAGKPACAGVRPAITYFNQHLTPTSIAFYTGPQAQLSRNQMLVTLNKRIRGEGADLRRFVIEGNSATGFTATEVLPRIIESFGVIDLGDGPVETAIDPISGDIYVARFDPVTHRPEFLQNHVIYRIHRAGSDALPFIGPVTPSAVKAGSSGITISITGRRLQPGAIVVNVTDNIVLATRQGATRFDLVADLPASALQSERTLVLEVRNPDGAASNQQTFAVTKGNVVDPPPPLQTPHLNRLFVYKKRPGKVVDPLTVGSATKKLRLVVEGTDFDLSAQLLVGNVPLEIISITGTEIVARVTSDMVSSPREMTVQVRNSNGRVSNTLTLRVVQ
jgi:glucose/arabinose dehydrogenase